jgi:purine-binding chemotaxis protein CheW
MQEVLMYHDVTRLPRTPAYLLGITSLRGKVIPVIDLRERLGIRGPEPQTPRVLVLRSEDEPVGARVDSVTGVIRTWTDEILPALNTLSEEEVRFIAGVVRVDGRFVSLLAPEEILKIELEV